MTMVTQNNASDSLPISGQPLSDEVQSNPNTLRQPPLPPILEGGQVLLVIIHWDAEEGRFLQKVIFPPLFVSNMEHASFAPIDL